MFIETIINKGYKTINPIRFGFEKCEKGHFWGPMARFYWLFHFVISGKGTYYIEGKTYNVSAGMMFVIPPQIETYYEADIKEPWEYIWVGFTGEPPLELKDIYNIPHALDIFVGMKHSHNLNNGRTEYILAKLWELFSLLLEEENSNSQKSDPIEIALSLIHSEYMTPITVQQIADRIHLDRVYFSNLFRKHLGISPKKYILNYRMEQAKILLQKGYSVTTTAISVGYQDVFIFSKMFKRHFNYSPSEYLKRLNNKK